MSAREIILDRIRAANRDAAAVIGSAPGRVETPARDRADIIADFTAKLRDYGVVVRSVPERDCANAVADALAGHGIADLVIPADLPENWLPPGVAAIRDEALDYRRLDRAGGVLTGCALAIAETGTIILDSGPRQGRRALTLVPDYHLCIVGGDQLVGSVPEAISRLESSGAARRPLTFISGPSATADIELDRVVGVHGPRTLEVIILDR